MADNSLHDLNYGRPGLTIYDLDNHEWNTSRHHTLDVLKQVAEWQLAIPAAISFSSATTSTNATTTRKHVRQLTHNHPQLVSAAEQLPELGIVSEAVTSSVTTYDPNVGDLFSFGTVHLKQFVRPKQIAALPTGPSGSVLRLVPLGKQRQGWENDKSVWLSGPAFKIVDSAYWNEDAAPIQQICFAQTDNSNSFLAVRLLSKTVLFRPLYHRGRRAAKPSLHYDLPPSLLSARPLLHLAAEETGGAPHADVAFNPDYQFQFGVIDQHYRWSLWQIERRAKREEYSVSRMVGGDILPDENDTSDGDGWSRIMWAGDSNTLILCNRRHLSVVNLEGGTFDYFQAPVIIPQRSTDWILDIKRHPQFQNRFFVLTSTRLFLIAVTTRSAAIDSTADEAGASIVLSQRHYRGDEDITLQINVEAVEGMSYLFITSRLNKLVQVYHFPNYSSSFADFVATTNPVALGLDFPYSGSIHQMHLHVLEYGTKVVPQHRQSNAFAQSCLSKSVPFYQLTVIMADLSVYQTVLLSSGYHNNPEPLVWRRVVVAKHSLDARSNVDEMDDFVEPNGPDWDAEPESKLTSQMPRLVSSSNRAIASGTADRMAAYDALIQIDQSAGASVSLKDLTDQLREVTRGDLWNFGSRHMMEFLESVDVADVDEDSERLEQVFADENPQNTYSLRPIATPNVLRLPSTQQTSIADLYDIILRDWIAPLPADISVPVRQAKERLARRVAAEVTLAGASLRPRVEEQPGIAPGQPMSLPILPPKSASLLPSSSLPTPPQSSVPPSSPLLTEYVRPLAGDPLSRLRKHLTIDDESSSLPMVLAPSVSELLSHWQPGTDPSTYDWEATERTLRPEMLDDESQESREKERKKKERRDKRQRREDELMRAKTQTSSQPMFLPPAGPRSSPGPSFGGMAASSQVPMPMSQMSSQVHGVGGGFGGFGGGHGMMPQSQAEPGKFGGRPEKKKKKGKSRVSGF
ncbi:hypothetical protein OPT61_g340 [Boeremia exigua]|uniref:Uncharacterized protein n=1 Tax=Boeremia exigua TaxID=749465 RepID=A0ACC2IU62_9PLEO|nr:hypothetical protein OPT61_g340 [Boeremia exigua]